jgi:membrane-bound serine protease (ClpP class)
MRACAERYGHNPDVIEAMIDPNQELVIGEEILSPKGELLTLTSEEAARKYGESARPLLSLGTIPSLEKLYRTLGVDPAQVKKVEKIGFESIASWISAWSSILLIIGGLGLFIEYKTPVLASSGLSGLRLWHLFSRQLYRRAGRIGVACVIPDRSGLGCRGVVILPGFMIFGFLGLLLMVVSLIMGMVDFYPGGGWLPHWDQLRLPFLKFGAAMVILTVLALLIGRYSRIPSFTFI